MLLLCCLGGLVTTQAQGFKLMRFEENYYGLKDSSRNFYNRFKYTPLSKDGRVYLSAGGSARVEYVDFNNEDWGASGIGHNGFLLQRYDVHADVHVGQRLRLFAQLRSAWEGGRKNGPRPIDEDHGNVQNLFVDVVAVQHKKQTLTARIGRQELDYGSGRLISVREGPNLRLYFTGAKVMYASERFFADAFVMAADTVNTGAFDNKQSKQANLWGVYSKLILPHAGNVDLYYLGIRRDAAVFEEGAGKEVRHTIGGRLWKYGGGFIYNFEGAYQFGKFGAGNISAWTASADIGYMFEDVKGKPTINLRHDYISGDSKQGDGKLQTFNPLYPKGGYFGFSPQIGPVNLIDIHPYATIAIGAKAMLQADAVFNWRYSLQDGVYRPSGGFNKAGAGAPHRYIGTAWLGSVVYTFNRFVSWNTGMQYFRAGSFIQDLVATPKSGVFINSRLSFKF
ncbi:Alginate export [Filimonas lacunae]|uniref:Alginate export n=2 Tax=Filimonas lacunae TaxID=477680 RepID=A0A1N7QW84_9BACT|nr:Alginate export [Filimonas lacunae]